MELISNNHSKREIKVSLDVDSGNLYVGNSCYELEDDVLDVIDSLMTELNVLELALYHNVGLNMNAES